VGRIVLEIPHYRGSQILVLLLAKNATVLLIEKMHTHGQ